MSEQNIEVVRRAVEDFNERDVEALVQLSHPDCEWLPFRAQLEGSVYRGHEGVRRFVSDMGEDWSEFRIELEELSEAGERVLLIGSVHAESRDSGLTVKNRVGFLFDFRDATIHRLVSYGDPDAARRAAAA